MKSPDTEGKTSSRYQPLTVVLAAFCAGIVGDRVLSLPPHFWAAAGVGSLLGWLLLLDRHRDGAAALLLVFAIGATGAVWHHCRWSLFAKNDLGALATDEPAPVCLEATVLKGPRRVAPPPFDPMRVVPAGIRSRLLVRARRLRDGATWRPVSGRATLTVDGQLLGVHAGDRVRIFGSLSKPHPVQNPGGFDQASYLRGNRQLARLWASYPDCVQILEPAGFRGVTWWIERLRDDARRTLRQNLSPDRAQLASAVLLGAREEIDPEQTNVFVETGSVHLLAISGLHVGIVAGVLLLLLRAIPISRTSAFWIVVGWTVAYALLTDARPPAIRATILVAVLCFARLRRRPASPWNSLAAAGLIVLALNPADLFATGVHLSFLAVATLMCVSPRWFVGTKSNDPLEQLIDQSRGPWQRAWRWGWTRTARLAAAATAVWLVTLPLVMSRFHVVALAAVLLNVVLWVPMTAALVTGFLTILSGWFLPAAVPWFACFCDTSLWTLQRAIEAAHQLPGNPVYVAGMPDWWLLGFYALLPLAVYTTLRTIRWRRGAWGSVAIWLAVGVAFANRFPPKDQLVCTIAYVGHGSAAIVEFPGGPVILCDAGRLASPISGARDISACLWTRRIRRLDAILLSHADADHFNAIPELLRRFPVDAVYTPPGVLDGDRGAVRALRESIGAHAIPVRCVVSGDRLRLGEALVQVLHPPDGSRGGSDNAGSMVLSVEYADRRIILPGDVEEEGLQTLLGCPPRPCDVLVAPHHGSLNTDVPGLAAWCSPRWVIISGYHEPRNAPVARAYRQTGAKVLYTGDVGAVTVVLEADRVLVETQLRR